jgi:Amt family ammonium transporter
MTSFLMLFIKYVLRIPLRMSDEKLLIGDDAVHGEDAYAFGDMPSAIQYRHSQEVARDQHDDLDAELGVIQGESASNGDDEINPAGKKEGY